MDRSHECHNHSSLPPSAEMHCIAPPSFRVAGPPLAWIVRRRPALEHAKKGFIAQVGSVWTRPQDTDSQRSDDCGHDCLSYCLFNRRGFGSDCPSDAANDSCKKGDATGHGEPDADDAEDDVAQAVHVSQDGNPQLRVTIGQERCERIRIERIIAEFTDEVHVLALDGRCVRTRSRGIFGRAADSKKPPWQRSSQVLQLISGEPPRNRIENPQD